MNCVSDMNLVRQPDGSSLCGQCVVAMLAGIPLADVIAAMGEGRSYPANIRKGLKRFSVSIPSRSTPGTVTAPAGRGAAMLWGKRQHWVAWDNGYWFDPASDILLQDLSHYEPDAVALYPVGGKCD